MARRTHIYRHWRGTHIHQYPRFPQIKESCSSRNNSTGSHAITSILAVHLANAAILINEVSTYDQGMKYILYLRGVFKTYNLRTSPPASGVSSTVIPSGGGLRNGTPLDETGKQVLRELLDLMKPYLRA